MISRPHFDFPFRRSPLTGKVAVVEQDTEAHVIACENTIVRCPLGFRDDRPDFGWDMPEFRPIPLDLQPLETALRKFEPRGKATASQYLDAAEAATLHVPIDVEV